MVGVDQRVKKNEGSHEYDKSAHAMLIMSVVESLASVSGMWLIRSCTW